jgi:hypothetical protein
LRRLRPGAQIAALRAEPLAKIDVPNRIQGRLHSGDIAGRNLRVSAEPWDRGRPDDRQANRSRIRRDDIEGFGKRHLHRNVGGRCEALQKLLMRQPVLLDQHMTAAGGSRKQLTQIAQHRRCAALDPAGIDMEPQL